MSEAASLLTSLALCPLKTAHETHGNSKLSAKRTVPINLVPSDDESSMLSQYNNLLVRHSEFFFPSSSDNRVGLRCIHCKDHPQHITAATFFPSTIGSISSGLGTIGARHFGWGKCPSVPPNVQKQMVDTKNISNLETRSRSRIGLRPTARSLYNNMTHTTMRKQAFVGYKVHCQTSKSQVTFFKGTSLHRLVSPP